MKGIKIDKEKFYNDPFKLNEKAKQKGYRYRWETLEDLDYRLDAEGWELVTGEEKDKLRPAHKHISGKETAQGDICKVGELVLIKVKEDVIKERDDFFLHEANSRVKNAREELKNKTEEKNAELKKKLGTDEDVVKVIGKNSDSE